MMERKLYFLLLVRIFASPNAEITHARRRAAFCTAGFYSSTAKEPCTSCGEDQWSMDASFSCNDCRTCQPGSKVIQQCASDTPKICSQCPAGTYNNETDITTCYACVNDTWSRPGAIECIDCVTCPVGTYQHQNCTTTVPRACRECPAGTYSNITDAYKCETCPDGTWSTTGAALCTECAGPCDVGHFISVECTPTTNLRCEECDAGTYAGEINSTQCTTCDSGTWSVPGESECRTCTKCLPGHQIRTDCTTTNDRLCEECPAGTYEAGNNSNACAACSAGTTWSPVGALECTNCLVCQPGHYQSVACTTTVPGVCAECPAGTYTSTTSQAASSSCVACSGGYWSVEGATECTICESCPAGTYNAVECTTTSARKCTSCPPGTYTSSADQSTCSECSDGTYAPEGSTGCETCTTCNPGHFITEACTNSTDTQCGECDAGYYQGNSNEESCTECTEGVNWSEEGATECETCTVCQPGHYVSRNCTTIIDTQCTECLSGTYATDTDELECLTCEAETWSRAGASECETCSTCQPGFYFSVDCTVNNDRRCTQCEAGTYSSSTDEAECTPCEAGTTWSFAGASSCNQCVTCQPGFYVMEECDVAQPRICSQCGAGNYSDTTNAGSCTECESDHFSLAGATQCTMIA